MRPKRGQTKRTTLRVRVRDDADLTRTPNLLIRSYWHTAAPFNRCSSACVRMPAEGSRRPHGLLYPPLYRMATPYMHRLIRS
jgi:hypothetical protein